MEGSVTIIYVYNGIVLNYNTLLWFNVYTFMLIAVNVVLLLLKYTGIMCEYAVY